MQVEDIRSLLRWIAALRSGFFPQGEGRLICDNGSYCCLGVQAIISPDIIVQGDGVKNDGLTSHFTLPVNHWPFCEIDLYQGELSSMNDEGASFEEIADFIENRLKDYLECGGALLSDFEEHSRFSDRHLRAILDYIKERKARGEC